MEDIECCVPQYHFKNNNKRYAQYLITREEYAYFSNTKILKKNNSHINQLRNMTTMMMMMIYIHFVSKNRLLYRNGTTLTRYECSKRNVNF